MGKGVLSRLLGAAVLLGALGFHGAQVADADAATCSISGGAGWSSSVTTVPGTHTFSFALTWSCSGTGDEAGTWNINFVGTSPDENCFSGHATPGVTGGIEGQAATSTALTMSQTVNAFTFDGTITDASETHHVHAQVTVATPLCPWPANTSFPASGSGTLADA
jgi:hypothetical protein